MAARKKNPKAVLAKAKARAKTNTQRRMKVRTTNVSRAVVRNYRRGSNARAFARNPQMPSMHFKSAAQVGSIALASRGASKMQSRMKKRHNRTRRDAHGKYAGSY